MDDSRKFEVKRFLEDMNVKDTDFVFVFDSDGVAKIVHLPFYLDDESLLPESISAMLELYYAYSNKETPTFH